MSNNKKNKACKICFESVIYKFIIIIFLLSGI